MNLVDAFRSWVAANPTIYRVSHGSPTITGYACGLDVLPGLLTQIFTVDASVTVTKITSDPNNLDMFGAWYDQIYSAA